MSGVGYETLPWRALILVAALALPGCAADAQTVSGRVLRPDSATTVAGITVSLVNTRGQAIASVISNNHGEFRLHVVYGGQYTLRALQIGFRPTIVGVALPDTGRISRDIVLTGRAVVLDTISISEGGDCDLRGRDATTFVDLWDQARAALTARQVSERESPFDLQVVTYDGRIDDLKYHGDMPDGSVTRALNERIDSTSVRVSTVAHGFATTSRDSLLQLGYIRRNRDGRIVFDAPSPDVLLSDEFAARHCFGLKSPPKTHDTWIGVAFHPRRDHDVRIDVAGILWLDRRSAELRRLEFTYTGLPKENVELCDDNPPPEVETRRDAPQCYRMPAERFNLGGTLDFARLPTNDWIVSRWTMRTPADSMRIRWTGFRARNVPPHGSERCYYGKGCDKVFWPWPRLVTANGIVTGVWYEMQQIYRDDSAEPLVTALRVSAPPR